MDLSPLVFNSSKDLHLRILFQTSAVEVIWDRFYKDVDFDLIDFSSYEEQMFDPGIEYIQDKRLEILHRMKELSVIFYPAITNQDLSGFFNQVQPLRQLESHQAAREQLKAVLYAICKLSEQE